MDLLMADMASIATALAAVLETIEDIDRVSTVDYLPALDSMSIMALVVPFEQDGTFEQQDLSGETLWVKPTQKVEFWCKVDVGQPADALQRARTIGQLAVLALMRDDGNGYSIDRMADFRQRVDTGFVTVANVPWLVAHLFVPLEYEVTL